MQNDYVVGRILSEALRNNLIKVKALRCSHLGRAAWDTWRGRSATAISGYSMKLLA